MNQATNQASIIQSLTTQQNIKDFIPSLIWSFSITYCEPSLNLIEIVYHARIQIRPLDHKLNHCCFLLNWTEAIRELTISVSPATAMVEFVPKCSLYPCAMCIVRTWEPNILFYNLYGSTISSYRSSIQHMFQCQGDEKYTVSKIM